MTGLEPKDLMTNLAEVQQAVAAGEFVMAPTDGQRIEELEERIREVREIRDEMAEMGYDDSILAHFAGKITAVLDGESERADG